MRRHRTRGIPTVVDGIRFRSRLEARWYLWFSFLGWSPEYEPIDCLGWLPDFAITPPDGSRLVECKPALDGAQLAMTQGKVERALADSAWVGSVLLVGVSPAVALETTETPGLWLPPGWWPKATPLLKAAWADAVNRTQWRPRRRPRS